MALLISFLKVRIGAMLAYTPLDEKSLALLLSYLQDFLKWVFTRPPFVLLLVYRRWEWVKRCFVAGILWRTLRHFSMPVTTRWLLQSTTARPFKSLLYFTTWSFWVFKRVWSWLSQLWGCDSTTSLHGLMEGWMDRWRRKNPGKSSHSSLNKLIFFHVESCWTSSPGVGVLQHSSLVPLTLNSHRQEPHYISLFCFSQI